MPPTCGCSRARWSSPSPPASQENPWDFLRGILVPWIVLAAPLWAMLVRMTRTSMLEVRSEDFIRTAEGKGLAHRHVMRRHALRASLSPVVSLTSVSIPLMATNIVLVERVFSVPGFFRYTQRAVEQEDLALLSALAIFAAALIVLATIAVDLALSALDPRVRAG